MNKLIINATIANATMISIPTTLPCVPSIESIAPREHKVSMMPNALPEAKHNPLEIYGSIGWVISAAKSIATATIGTIENPQNAAPVATTQTGVR